MPMYNNKFKSVDHIEETVIDKDGGVIGTIRVKPSSILWKPKNKRKFYSVSLDFFSEWITSQAAGAKEVSS